MFIMKVRTYELSKFMLGLCRISNFLCDRQAAICEYRICYIESYKFTLWYETKSILDPLLFIILIDDLPYVTYSAAILLYADDLT